MNLPPSDQISQAEMYLQEGVKNGDNEEKH